MKRRRGKPASKVRRKAPTPLPAVPALAVTPADPLADQRIRPLLDQYCSLAGVKQAALGPDHSELKLPTAERSYFRDRGRVRVAFSLDPLEHDPDAELAVLGSPFLSQLLEAIRARAARLSLGLIAGEAPLSQRERGTGGEVQHESRDALTIPVRDGGAKLLETTRAAHPVGRLVARVVLRAGAGVEEAVVESDLFDLSAGAKVSADLAAAFAELEEGRMEAADPSLAEEATLIPSREPGDLLPLLVSNLQEKSAERVAARRAAAEQALAVELGRLDRYFASILKEQSSAAAIETVTALAERRRTEEIRRSQVKAVVHPLQLIEAAAVIHRAEWRLESTPPRGRHATLSAQRALGGGSPWSITCPLCGRHPAMLVICRHDHCGCDACSHRCSVCEEDFCAKHGIVECRVDGEPVCDEHTRVCPACRLQHCSRHEGRCSEGEGHAACTACVGPCESCGRVVCNRHAEQSNADAPRGSRRLCSACLRHCEGGTNEAVGVDELSECATCGKAVCMAHGAKCTVDGKVHCSQHLRRTDKSERVVCARHRTGCADEPTVLFATDEVEECPVCGKHTCARHRAACSHCGRQVCFSDLRAESGHCATCAQLAATSAPPQEVVTAVRTATGGAGRESRRLRVARDRRHLVVEVDLGFRRRAVVTVRHGESTPDSVLKHSLLGSKRRN